MKFFSVSLSTKAVLSILAILLPIIAMFIVNYQRNYDQVRENTLSDLRTIAEAYEVQTYQFIEMNRQRAVDFSSDGFIKEELLKLSKDPSASPEKFINHLKLNKLPLDSRLDSISILSVDGQVVASTDETRLGKNLSKEPYFTKALKGTAFIEARHFHHGSRPVDFLATSPITDRDSGKLIGVLVNSIPLNELNKVISGEYAKGLRALTVDWKRETMEVYLVNKEHLFITDSTFVEDAILKEKVGSIPVDLCLNKGEEMAGFYKGYRGVEVAGASMCIPSMGWVLLAEMDSSVVMNAHSKTRRDAILTALIVLTVVIFLAGLFYRNIVMQIKRLSEGARVMAGGDYHVSIPVASGDEIGSLSESFNRMAREIEARTKKVIKSETSLAEAQRIAKIGNWDWDIVNNTLYWSKEIYRIFGLSFSEFGITYEAFLYIVHPLDKEAVSNAVAEALKAPNTPYSIDHRIVLPDGSERIVHEEGTVDFDGLGKAIRMVGTVQDITERKLAEEKVRHAQQKTMLHIERTPLAVIEWNTDFEVTEWNPAAEEVFGYSRSEALGRKAIELMLPESAVEYADEIWERLLEAKGGFRSTNENVTKEGDTIVCEWHNTPLVDSAGEVIGVASMVHDVTQSRMAEERIRYLDRLLKAIRSINRLITRISDPDNLLQTACVILTSMNEYPMVWIGMVEDGHKRVVPRVSAGDDKGYLSSINITWDDEPSGMGPSGMAIKSRRPCIVREIDSDPRYSPWKDAAIERGYNSSVALPVVVGGHVYGVLNVYSSLVDGFDEEETELLMEVVDDLAFALGAIESNDKRMNAEEGLLRSNNLLYILRRAQSKFISSVGVEDVFAEALKDILLLTKSEFGFIGDLIHGEDGSFLRIIVASNQSSNSSACEFFDLNSKSVVEFRNPDTLIGEAVTTGEPVISNDPASDPRSGGLPDGHPALTSFLGMPLFSGTGMEGLLGLANRDEGYDNKLVDFLKPIVYAFGNITRARTNELKTVEVEKARELERRRFFTLLNSLPVMVYLQARDYSISFANDKFKEEYGDPGDKSCHKAMWDRKEPCEYCPPFNVFETGKPEIWESTHEASGKVFQVYDYPFTDTDGTPLVLEVSIDITELKNTEAELHQLIKEMTNIEDRERRRLSEQLHEGIGQNLSAMKLVIMGAMKQGVEYDINGMEKIVSMLDETIGSTRSLTADLYPRLLDDMGFKNAIKWYANSVMEPNGLKVSIRFKKEVDNLTDEIERNLFHICRESCQNIMKYAAASRVDIRCGREDGMLVLSIKDNGKGFSLDKIKTKSKRGFGLILMREWADAIGGEFSISSAPDSGAEVVVKVKL